MSSKFTPGPWAVSDIGAGFEIEATIDGHSQVIAQSQQLRFTDRETGHTERRANANLIAAAPDLYTALEWCVKHLEQISTAQYPDTSPALRRFNSTGNALAALAKADGK